MIIKEEFSAVQVISKDGKRKKWKADTYEALKKKLYRYMKKTILKEKANSKIYQGVEVLPYEEMKEEYTPCIDRKKYSVPFVTQNGGYHRHYLTVTYGHYGICYTSK